MLNSEGFKEYTTKPAKIKAYEIKVDDIIRHFADSKTAYVRGLKFTTLSSVKAGDYIIETDGGLIHGKRDAFLNGFEPVI